jgi:hypothetical protein
MKSERNVSHIRTISGNFMKTKILLLSVVSILIISLAAGAFWWLLRPQVITFDSGDKLTLLKVDYGKKHAPPGSKTTAARGRRGAAFSTPTDTLVFWVRQEHKPKQFANFQYYLYDKAGAACVGYSGMNYGNGNRQQGSEVVGIQFGAFPRRQGKFLLRAQENSPDGQEMSDQKFVIRNPARGSFPTWTPDSLPVTQDDDDVSVTLTKLVAGAAMQFTRDNDDPDDAVNKGVQATFNVQRNGKPLTNWEPVSVETSDATGNHVSGWVAKNDWNGNDNTAAYQYGLWPDEPAWKIRFEFSQKSDFAGGELWSVQGIPVQPGRQMDFWNYANRRAQTDAPFAETDLNGFHLKIFPAKQFTDMPPNSQPQGGLFIEAAPPLPSGMRLTVVKLTDDQTNDVGFWENTYSPNRNVSLDQCQLRDLGGATNLNVTIALHKSRFVEFTVKPEIAPAEAAQ